MRDAHALHRPRPRQPLHAVRARLGAAGSLAALLLFLAACGGPDKLPLVPQPTATPTPPSADEVAATFFQAWQQGQYSRMYDTLTTGARISTSQDAFVRRYTNIHDGIGETRLAIETQPAVEQSGPAPAASPSALASPAPPPSRTAGVPFKVTRSVAIFGDVSETNELPLVQEQGQWRVAWSPGLIFQGLTSGNAVRQTPRASTRGRILDRNGKPLADNGTVLTVGVVRNQIEDEARLVAALGEVLGMPTDAVKQAYQGGQSDWFMPVAVRPEADRPALAEKLGTVAGAVVQDTPARVYPLADSAAGLTGYVSHPTSDDLRQLASRGYDEHDWVGRVGLEATQEQALAGEKGGSLTIVDQAGKVVRTIAEKSAAPGSDVTLAVDADVQAKASQILGDRTGSVVVLDPRDNSVRALVSHPSFDPNHFILGISDQEWQTLNGPGNALVFRAVESAYPPASTFKVVTMSAGLERGGFKTSDTFDCGLDWNGLPGVTLHNWQQQGTLDLVESLTESCNPAFYTIGLKLDQTDPTILPTFARGFGFGQATGLKGLSENRGLVPDPTWKQQQTGRSWTSGDGVNMAIGQGFLQVTPLQLANAYSALASGGRLRSPLLIQRVGQQVQSAADRGTLPIGDATRAAILEGMQRVVSTPNGTASVAFRGERTPTAAKTGSAENENPDAHAWFVGFQTPDEPRALAVVMVEGGQMGGTTAAPLARQLLDAAYPVLSR